MTGTRRSIRAVVKVTEPKPSLKRESSPEKTPVKPSKRIKMDPVKVKEEDENENEVHVVGSFQSVSKKN